MSSNGLYQARMQSDGNLVVYKGNDAIWASNTVGKGNAPYTMSLQGLDNHMVVYDKDLKFVWGTGAYFDKMNNNVVDGGYAIMQDDGNFVVYNGNGDPLWNSGTTGGQSSDKWGSGYISTGRRKCLLH